MTNLETLKQKAKEAKAKLQEMEAEIDRLENGWEMKYPFKNGQRYFVLCQDGDFSTDSWVNHIIDKNRFLQGNAFSTKEAAELEAKRRNLLTRFRAFRDECNRDWKPDWKSENERKYYLMFQKGEFLTFCYWIENKFNQFGYFKNEQDAKRAIELFGKEIIELFVECE